MNSVYLCDGGIFGNESEVGVRKKIQSQIRLFDSMGWGCKLATVSFGETYVKRILARLPCTSFIEKWPDVAEFNEASFVYIRKPHITKGFVRFLAKLRKSRPDLVIVMEVPTYPYDHELRNLKWLAILIKERIHRDKLGRYLDRIATLSDDEYIFHVPTLKIQNGIDLEEVVARKPSSPTLNADAPLNAICVACFQHWHGVDRFIEGMANDAELLHDRRLHLHLLGDGPALGSLKKQVAQLHLDNSVTFYGRCDQETMSKVYNECTIAVASLGLHRIGLHRASTLKTREYLAKGIPFVYSGEIDVIQDDPIDFCSKVPDDDNPIDIAALVEFHDSLYKNSEEAMVRRVREYAEAHVGMEVAMGKFISYIKEKCKNGN